MELPGFHEELKSVVRRYAFLAADQDQTLRELERFVQKLKGRQAAKGSDFLDMSTFNPERDLKKS